MAMRMVVSFSLPGLTRNCGRGLLQMTPRCVIVFITVPLRWCPKKSVTRTFEAFGFWGVVAIADVGLRHPVLNRAPFFCFVREKQRQ